MQISTEPKGWSDDEVDQALLSLDNIDQSAAGLVNLQYITMDAMTMTVFILATMLGYMVSVWFLPATTDIGRW